MERAIIELIKKAHHDLDARIEAKLKEALEREDGDIARLQLENILENVKLAREKRAPMCQDTGVHLFFVRQGRGKGRKEIEKAIINALRLATEEVPLRPNAVDPITRKNTGKGMPLIYWLEEAERTEVAYMAKGAGSENCSSSAMLKPDDDIESFIVEVVKSAGGKPCPPVIIGVGIGGTFDSAAALAKKALLREMGKGSGRKEIAEMEGRLLERINRLGIGPMGFGGRTTCLGVCVEVADCHTASLPVAVNVECWAHRVARGVIE